MRATQEWLDKYLARSQALKDLEAQMERRHVPLPIASPAPPAKAKRAKYGNRKVVDAEGNVHDSTKEYRRWQELELRQRAGEISQLHRQPVFDLAFNGVLVCLYRADASYVEGGAVVVEDTKPSDPKFRKTLAYRHFKLKAKLMLACHGIQVREV